MTTQARERDYDERDDELSAIARSLHREWDSPGSGHPSPPGFWLATRHRGGPRTSLTRTILDGRWQALAAAAVIAITLAPTSWLGWRWFMLGPRPDPATRRTASATPAHRGRAGRDRTIRTAIHRAIDDLTRLAAPRLDMPDSPLLVNLRSASRSSTRRSPSIAPRLRATVSMRICVSSSCGSTRRSVARSNRFRSTRPMRSRDFSRPVAIPLAQPRAWSVNPSPSPPRRVKR